MEKQLSRYQKLQKKYSSKTSTFFKDADAKKVLEAISTGENYYLRRNTVETSAFDSTWIARIEDCLGDIGEILKDPKKITKTIENLTPVELAKKTNAVSVRHLASHTQFIKEIKDNGDVIPNKILSIESDDDYATYENRFIATLIRRLVLFVEKRYDFIMKYAPLKTVEEMKIKSKTIIDGSMVEIETTVKVTKPSDYKGIDEDNKYIERISEVRHYLRYYYSSQFMKMMKTEKDVRSPIIMTNILRKNPKYNKCYRLFKFIETYDGLGISYSLSGGYLKLDDQNLKEINEALMANFLALNAGEPSRLASEIHKTHKPKVLKSEEDELFEFNSNFKGPIEFIRVDEQYRNLTETLTKMPKSMRKEEEEYNADTRLENREKRIFKDLTNKLLARRKKEVAEFDKKAKAIVAKREKEEAERIKKLEELARKERERLENEARKALIEQAKADLKALNEENKQEKKKKKAKPVEVIEEVTPVEEVTPAEEAPVQEEPVVESTPTEEPATQEVQPEPVEQEIPEEIKEEEVIEPAPVEEKAEEIVPEQPQEPIEEVVQEDAPVQEEPVVEPIPEEKEEVVEEVIPEQVEAVQENNEVPAEEPVVEETPAAEEPEPTTVVEEVKEEPKKKAPRKKAPAKKKAAPKKKAKKVVEEKPVETTKEEVSEPVQEDVPTREAAPIEPIVEETPVEEVATPVEEPVVEEQPVTEELIPVVEEAKEETQPVEEVKKPVKKPARKKAPAKKKAAPKKEKADEKKPAPKKKSAPKKEEVKPVAKKPSNKKPSDKKKKKEPYVSKPVQTYKPVEKPKAKLNPNFKPKFKRNKIKRRK